MGCRGKALGRRDLEGWWKSSRNQGDLKSGRAREGWKHSGEKGGVTITGDDVRGMAVAPGCGISEGSTYSEYKFRHIL